VETTETGTYQFKAMVNNNGSQNLAVYQPVHNTNILDVSTETKLPWTKLSAAKKGLKDHLRQ
jgi:hypothetical protein